MQVQEATVSSDGDAMTATEDTADSHHYRSVAD